MKKTLRLLATAAMVLPVAAHAQEGWYVSGAGGASWLHDASIEAPGVNLDAEYDMGWTGLLGVGYGFGNNLRTELELGYRSNDIDSISGLAGSTGDAQASSAMINLLYDFANRSPLTPYLGVGAGMVNVDYDGVAPVAATTVSDDDTVGAVQGIVGVDWAVADQLSVFGQYNYLHAFEPEVRTVANTPIDTEYQNSSFVVGLRYSFGAPAAVPQAKPQPARLVEAPRPAPVQRVEESDELPSYLVFFDWDRADLSAEARELIAKAAKDAGRGRIARIEVTGHADRSGTDKYNQKLSQKRADAVRQELVRQGVNVGEIATYAKGEREPLVPTADNVREPQNRRVEIYYKQ